MTERDHLEDSDIDWGIILKWILTEIWQECQLDLTGCG